MLKFLLAKVWKTSLVKGEQFLNLSAQKYSEYSGCFEYTLIKHLVTPKKLLVMLQMSLLTKYKGKDGINTEF